jgi:hypothetical protein
MNIELINNYYANNLMKQLHYRHTLIINSKLLSYGIYEDTELKGVTIWASTPMTKKETYLAILIY